MDSYIKPGEVHAPKRHWRLFHVLFDGGQAAEERSGTSSSLAIGRWDDKPVLAMRWNGGRDSPLGNPQSRGLPTWFIVPDQHVRQILQTGQYALSDSKLEFAREFLELRRVYFLSHCPTPTCTNFRNLVLASYRSDELSTRQSDLEKGELKFYCIYCDQQWYPTAGEKVRLSAELTTGWDLYRAMKS